MISAIFRLGVASPLMVDSDLDDSFSDAIDGWSGLTCRVLDLNENEGPSRLVRVLASDGRVEKFTRWTELIL